MLHPIQHALVSLELAALPRETDSAPIQNGRAVLAQVLGVSDLITTKPLGPNGVAEAAKAAGDKTRARTETLQTAGKFATVSVGFFALLVVL